MEDYRNKDGYSVELLGKKVDLLKQSVELLPDTIENFTTKYHLLNIQSLFIVSLLTDN